MEDEAAKAAGSPDPPTAEGVAGRQLRMLRQGHGWSQQEVANRMRKLGYKWQQSTVGKIEAAARPLRLNELADLAAALAVPVTHFLRPDPAPDDATDLDAVEREIRALLRNRMDAVERADWAQLEYFAATDRFHGATDAVQQMDSRLRTLKLWHPRYDEIARAVLEDLAEATASDQARRIVGALSAADDAVFGWTPDRAVQLRLEALLKPYAELLGADHMDRIGAVFREAVQAAMEDRDRGAP